MDGGVLIFLTLFVYIYIYTRQSEHMRKQQLRYSFFSSLEHTDTCKEMLRTPLCAMRGNVETDEGWS